MPARSPGSLYPTAAHTGATSRQIPPTVKKIICVPRRPNLKAVERQWQGSEWSRKGSGVVEERRWVVEERQWKGRG